MIRLLGSVFGVLLAVSAVLPVQAGDGGNEVPGVAQVADDITLHRSCPYCGMDREKWGFSRMLIEYDDGSSEGTCSLHCAAVSFAIHLDKFPKAIRVADYETRRLIDAETAAWVIGGEKAGVMSRRAKWAFATRDAAEAFIGANGGQPATFEAAIKAAYEDTYEDTKMIRARRAARRQAAAEAQQPPAPAPTP